MEYLIGPAMTIAELSRERGRKYIVMANIDGTDYDSSVIVDFEIENSVAPGDTLVLGAAALSRLTLKLLTMDVIPPNAKIIPYLAITINGEQVTDWYPMGEFYVDKREQVNKVWVFTCWDKLFFADVPYVSELDYPASMQDVWDEICDGLDYVSDSSVVIDPSYEIQAGPAGFSKRQVMGYIASANASSVYAGKDGSIKFQTYSSADEPVFEMLPSEYSRVKQVNPLKSYTRVVVTYDLEDGLTYEAGTGDANHTLGVINPFMTQEMTDDLLAALDGFAYIPVKMEALGFPTIDPGDRISFSQQGPALSWEDADIAWEDADFPWDGVNIYQTIALRNIYSFKGGLKMSIDAPSRSDQQSEFKVAGTLTEQINKLNQNAVRFNKPYYGISHSRTEGLVIEREDHLSKLILNSDVMDWQVDGESALYYDALANRLKFTGTLDAVDGIFSGTIQGGSFEGGNIVIGSGNDVFKADDSGIWLGHADFASAPFRVDMDGAAVANNLTLNGGSINWSALNTDPVASDAAAAAAAIADGTYSGGTFINGSTIYSPTITGPLIQTGTSGVYPRAEMSSSSKLFAAYESSNKRITIEASRSGFPYIGFLDNSSAAHIFYRDDSSMSIQSDKHLELTSVSGNIYLTADDFVVFGSWGDLYSDDESQTLSTALSGKANSSHTHAQSDITGLVSALSALTSALSGKASNSSSTGSAGTHNHSITPGLQVRVRDSGTLVESWVTYSAAPTHTHSQT